MAKLEKIIKQPIILKDITGEDMSLEQLQICIVHKRHPKTFTSLNPGTSTYQYMGVMPGKPSEMQSKLKQANKLLLSGSLVLKTSSQVSTTFFCRMGKLTLPRRPKKDSKRPAPS